VFEPVIGRVGLEVGAGERSPEHGRGPDPGPPAGLHVERRGPDEHGLVRADPDAIEGAAPGRGMTRVAKSPSKPAISSPRSETRRDLEVTTASFTPRAAAARTASTAPA